MEKSDMKKIPVLIFVIFILAWGTSIFSADQNEAEQIVTDALSKETGIDSKVKVLINLAWFNSEQSQEVSEVAKQRLKEFGRSIIDVLKKEILEAPPDVQKEMIPILIHAYDHRKLRWDWDYAHTFSALLRSPDKEIKMMAMDALAHFQVPRVTLHVIDAIYEDPSIELHGIKSLGLINDPKASKYLINKLASSDKAVADTAEEAISKMNWKMPLELKKGILDDRFNVRERCLRLFLAIAKVDDLSFLHYVSSKNENFDPQLLVHLQEVINTLEEEIKPEEGAGEEMELEEGANEAEGEEALEEDTKEEE
jgi:hypothetical protein